MATKKSPKRDPQQKKVYAAEDSLGWTAHRKLPLKECRSYARRIVNSKWFVGRYGVLNLEIVPGSKHSYARLKDLMVWSEKQRIAVISLPLWARDPLVIIHEIAHALYDGVDSHGPEYCRIYLELVRHYLGNRMSSDLRYEMRTRGVKIATRKRG